MLAVFVSIQARAPAASPLVSMAWDVLHQGLQSGSAYKRRQAVAAVGSIGDTPEALALVERALKEDKDVQVRVAAAAALGIIESPQSIPYLKEALDDKPEVAFNAAKSLWAIGDHSGAGVLEGVLKEERSDGPGLIGGAMRGAHNSLHHPAHLATMSARQTTGVFFGPASLGVVMATDAFKDKDAPARAQVAELLGESHEPRAIAMLEEALHDRSSIVRTAAAKSLGKAGDRDTIPKLATPMRDDSHYAVRYAAAASIIRLSALPQ